MKNDIEENNLFNAMKHIKNSTLISTNDPIGFDWAEQASSSIPFSSTTQTEEQANPIDFFISLKKSMDTGQSLFDAFFFKKISPQITHYDQVGELLGLANVDWIEQHSTWLKFISGQITTTKQLSDILRFCRYQHIEKILKTFDPKHLGSILPDHESLVKLSTRLNCKQFFMILGTLNDQAILKIIRTEEDSSESLSDDHQWGFEKRINEIKLDYTTNLDCFFNKKTRTSRNPNDPKGSPFIH